MARFTDLPLEIIQSIFGMVPFVDIENLRKSSPCMMVRLPYFQLMQKLFKGSKYAIKFGIMCEWDKEEIYEAMKKFPQQQSDWTIDQVLDTYTRSRCQHVPFFNAQ
jgi:hypothetical protein